MPTAYPNKSERLVHQQHAGNSVAIPRDLQCGYRSKICTSVRATKLDGTLHKLCEFHRLKANSSQRRLQKRRQQRKLEEVSAGKHARESDSEEPTTSADGRLAKHARVSGASSPTTADDSTAFLGGSVAYELNPSEMAMLEHTFFSSSSTLLSAGEAIVRVPAPLGLFDMDAVVADVLQEFNGPLCIPTLDGSNAFWAV